MGKKKPLLRKEVYDKYILPVKAMDKERKKLQCKEWFDKYFFNILSSIIAIAALVISIISMLR